MNRPFWLGSPTPDAAIEIAPERVSAAVIRGEALALAAHASEVLPAGAVVPSLLTSNIADRSAVADVLRRVLDRLATRPRRVALVIPDSVAKVSLIRFDTVPTRRDDLEQLVRWQIRKSAPFPIDDACVTYTPGMRVGDAGREFLVVTARRDIVTEYEAVCSEAGVYAGLVDLATLSLLNMYLGSGLAPTGDWLLVHVRADSTSIAIMRGDDVIFYRNRSDDEEESLADLVHQTAMYYQDRLSGGGFDRVLVGGAGRSAASVELVRRSVEERLGVTVEPVDPTRVAAIAGTVASNLIDVLGPLVGVLVRISRERVAA